VANFISGVVCLQRHSAPRIKTVSAQLIDVHQVQKVLRQQWLLVKRGAVKHRHRALAMRIHIVRALA
jgi:hypothetical protein